MNDLWSNLLNLNKMRVKGSEIRVVIFVLAIRTRDKEVKLSLNNLNNLIKALYLPPWLF
jgi:hypothetical protein